MIEKEYNAARGRLKTLPLYIASLKLQAEKLLKKLYATKNLRDATIARKLAALEKAIDGVKKGGWEKDLYREIQEANTLLEKVTINYLSLQICYLNCAAYQVLTLHEVF